MNQLNWLPNQHQMQTSKRKSTNGSHVTSNANFQLAQFGILTIVNCLVAYFLYKGNKIDCCELWMSSDTTSFERPFAKLIIIQITNLFQDDPSPIKGKACESSPYNLVWSFFIVANYLYLFARSSNTFTVHQFPYSCVVVYLAALPLDENQTTEIVFTTQYLVCSGFSTRATT